MLRNFFFGDRSVTEEVDDAAMTNLLRWMERRRSEVGRRSWSKDRTQRADAREDAWEDYSDKHRLSKITRVCCNDHDRTRHLHLYEVQRLEKCGSGKEGDNPPRHAIELEPNLTLMAPPHGKFGWNQAMEEDLTEGLGARSTRRLDFFNGSCDQWNTDCSVSAEVCVRCKKAVVDAYSESVQIDVSQTQHFCGVGAAPKTRPRNTTLVTAPDSWKSRDRPVDSWKPRETGQMKNHARRPWACRAAQQVPTEDHKRLAGRDQSCLTESCTCGLAPALCARSAGDRGARLSCMQDNSLVDFPVSFCELPHWLARPGRRLRQARRKSGIPRATNDAICSIFKDWLVTSIVCQRTRISLVARLRDPQSLWIWVRSHRQNQWSVLLLTRFSWGRSCAAKFCVGARPLTAKYCWSRGGWTQRLGSYDLHGSSCRKRTTSSLGPVHTTILSRVFFVCEISALLSLFEIHCILGGSQVKEMRQTYRHVKIPVPSYTVHNFNADDCTILSRQTCWICHVQPSILTAPVWSLIQDVVKAAGT